MSEETKPVEPTEEKKPFGRPTEYDPSYCDKVIELGKLGKSLEQMSAQLNVSYRTLCNWRENHEDFFHALGDAHALSQAWWEEMAHDYLIEHKDGERINTGLWSRSMAARFPKNYSERIKQEISGTDGEKIKGIGIMFVDGNGNKEG